MGAARLRLVVALTGASGMVFARALLRRAAASEAVAELHVVASDAARRVASEELDASGSTEEMLRSWTGEPLPRARIVVHPVRDIGATIASGSFEHDGMVVVPCSTATLGVIAHGTATNLVHRAAEVTLKERRKLLLMVRESPLSLVHLRNMVAVAEAGALVMPLMPPWYLRPRTIDELVEDTIARALDHLGIPSPDARRWKGES